MYVGTESDACCCFIILMIYGEVSLWYCHFFIKHCVRWETKKGRKVIFFCNRNIFFSLKQLFIYLCFLPNCEMQECEITDLQCHKPYFFPQE